MTKKRFSIIGDSNIEYLMQSKLLLPIYDKGVRLSLKSCCDVLNTQHEQIQELENEVFDWKASAEDYFKLGKSLKKENEELKKLNIPVNEIKDIVVDCKGRIIGVYYND